MSRIIEYERKCVKCDGTGHIAVCSSWITHMPCGRCDGSGKITIRRSVKGKDKCPE